MIEVLILGLVQVQTVRLPPAPPTTVKTIETPRVMEVEALPDLIVTRVRMVSENVAEFEVRNRGTAPTRAAVQLRACAYVDTGSSATTGGYQIDCSGNVSAGALDAGQARWVRIQCFNDRSGPAIPSGGLLPGSGPDCTDPTRGGQFKIAKFTVRVDPGPGIQADLAPAEIQAPAALQPDCSADAGCIRESNENNNRAELAAPLPGERG